MPGKALVAEHYTLYLWTSGGSKVHPPLGMASAHVDQINSLSFEDSISKKKSFQKHFAMSFYNFFFFFWGRTVILEK
jgi:hypothetical protein